MQRSNERPRSWSATERSFKAAVRLAADLPSKAARPSRVEIPPPWLDRLESLIELSLRRVILLVTTISHLFVRPVGIERLLPNVQDLSLFCRIDK
jgi:hypothetical protein